MHRAKCAECGEIVDSKFNHDYQQCDCPQATMVDGGPDRKWGRLGGKDLSKILVEMVPGSNEWIPLTDSRPAKKKERL